MGNNALYLKVKADLLNLIDSNRYNIGDRLLPELQLCKDLGVSRAALRKALDDLQNEGYILRVQGSGTILLKKRERYKLDLSRLGSAADIISGYTAMNIDYFKINEITAGSKYAGILGVDPEERLLDVERIRSLDDVPAIYTHDLLVKSRINFKENLYAEIAISLSKTMGWDIEQCDTNIWFCTADDVLSDKLSIPVGTALLCLEEIACGKDGLPLGYSFDYYIADLFDFHLIRR